MRSRIHVNQHIIRENKREGTDLPVLSIKTYKGNTKCREVEIKGPCKVIYSPDNPLDCGARVWIETQSEVTVIR